MQNIHVRVCICLFVVVVCSLFFILFFYMATLMPKYAFALFHNLFIIALVPFEYSGLNVLLHRWFHTTPNTKCIGQTENF